MNLFCLGLLTMNRMGLMNIKFKNNLNYQSWLQLDTYYLAGKLNSFLAPHK